MSMRLFQIQRRAKGLSIWHVLFWWWIAILLLRVTLVLLYRYRMRGREHVPATGPLLIIANHQSNIDPAMVGVLVSDRPFKAIARETLFKSKLLSAFMRGFGVISIKRAESDTTAIRAAIAELKAGRAVFMFPEGTRTRDGEIGTFQRGFWLLMRKSKATILPVGLDGAFDVWPIGGKPSLRGWVEAEAGEPIDASFLLALGEEAGTCYVHSTIDSLRLKCKERIAHRSSE